MEHLHPKKAHEILQESPNTLLIDCRTEAEFFYVGHPVEAISIEWNTELDFEINPQAHLQHLGRDVVRVDVDGGGVVLVLQEGAHRFVDFFRRGGAQVGGAGDPDAAVN